MSSIQPPSGFTFDGNLAEKWRKFIQRFHIYLTASGKAKEEPKVRTSILLCCLGEQGGLEVYNTLKLDEDEKWDFQSVEQQFEAYCIPRKNVILSRHIFFSRNQFTHESIDQFVTDLKLKTKD